MPTYEYVCSKCEHHFEKFQSMNDAPLAVCPKDLCPRKRWGKGKVKRVLGPGAGIIFKGSGFYITDYRSDSYKQAAKKESSGSEATKSETPKKETKPAKESKPASGSGGGGKAEA